MSEIINKINIPKHIAITMDGNGRWAKERGKKRVFGHNHGVKSVRDTIEGAVEYGIEFLTLFAFSTENWKRPKAEVNALMTLLIKAINKETKDLIKNNISLKTIGDISQLPLKCQKELAESINKTKDNTGMTLILALSYSGKWEIINAIKQLLQEDISSEDFSEDIFEGAINQGIIKNEPKISTSEFQALGKRPLQSKIDFSKFRSAFGMHQLSYAESINLALKAYK